MVNKKTMARKIAILGVVVAMLLSIGLLGACDITNNPTLADHQANAIEQLESYADALCEDDFCEVDWGRIESYVDSGISAINSATTKPAVDTALNNAKSNIDGVVNGGNPVEQGAFYRLAEAYANGWLSHNDLKNISYRFHNGEVVFNGQSIDFTPSAKTQLSESIEAVIKQDFLELIVSDGIGAEDLTTDDVIVLTYLGTYNGNVAIMLSAADIDYLPVMNDENIGGVLFSYGNSNFIRIWRPSQK